MKNQPIKLSPAQLKMKVALRPIVERILREQTYSLGTIIKFPETSEYGKIIQSKYDGMIAWKECDNAGEVVPTGKVGMYAANHFDDLVKMKRIVILK